MCYNVAYLEKRAERVAKHYGAHFKPEVPELKLFSASGFVHPQLPVVTSEEPQWINCYRWGLIPQWCKDASQAQEISKQTLNAKCETVFEKPSFRNSIHKKRCLVVVSGFFEWQTVGKNKYPYFVRLKEKDFFSLGGIYEHWVDKQSGELFNTFSVITVPANKLMSKIHNSMKRMPFIVPEKNEKHWIDNSIEDAEIKSLMQPYSDEEMYAYTISKRITDHKQNPNVPETIEPFEYPELALLDL